MPLTLLLAPILLFVACDSPDDPLAVVAGTPIGRETVMESAARSGASPCGALDRLLEEELAARQLCDAPGAVDVERLRPACDVRDWPRVLSAARSAGEETPDVAAQTERVLARSDFLLLRGGDGRRIAGDLGEERAFRSRIEALALAAAERVRVSVSGECDAVRARWDTSEAPRE